MMSTPQHQPHVARPASCTALALLIALCGAVTGLAVAATAYGLLVIGWDVLNDQGSWDGFGTMLGSIIAVAAGTVAVVFGLLTRAVAAGRREVRDTGDTTRLERARSMSAGLVLLGVVVALLLLPGVGVLAAVVVAALPVTLGALVYGVLQWAVAASPAQHGQASPWGGPHAG